MQLTIFIVTVSDSTLSRVESSIKLVDARSSKLNLAQLMTAMIHDRSLRPSGERERKREKPTDRQKT